MKQFAQFMTQQLFSGQKSDFKWFRWHKQFIYIISHINNFTVVHFRKNTQKDSLHGHKTHSKLLSWQILKTNLFSFRLEAKTIQNKILKHAIWHYIYYYPFKSFAKVYLFFIFSHTCKKKKTIAMKIKKKLTNLLMVY